MKALIDGDILVYRVGYAAQRAWYRFCYENGFTVDFPDMSLREVKAELKNQRLSRKDGRLTKVVLPDPLENALHSLKQMIQEILRNTDADAYQLYLTAADKSNYRFEIAKSLPYKGNRKQARPVHYQELRTYLTEVWKAEVISEKEADDALGIAQTNLGNQSIICSIDKDMMMIPGHHYNMLSREVSFVADPGELKLSSNRRKLTGGGIKWFYAQMLLGDNADNIPGIEGVGPVAVYGALNHLNTEKELAKQVLLSYTKSMPEWVAKERMYELADLLWIQRIDGERKSNHLKEILQ